MSLIYFKCKDCLTCFTSTEKHIDACACGGTDIETMGKVTGAKFIKTEELCSCDARCTHAQGPSCNCMCGGTNHGTGMTRRVVVASGRVTVADVDADALARAAEWKGAKEQLKAAFEARWGEADKAYIDGRWLDREVFMGLMEARKAYRAAIQGGKVHKTRMAKIYKAVDELNKRDAA